MSMDYKDYLVGGADALRAAYTDVGGSCVGDTDTEVSYASRMYDEEVSRCLPKLPRPTG